MTAVAPQTDASADVAANSGFTNGTTNGGSSSPSLMASLAETISRETAIVDKYFREHGGPQPGFGPDNLIAYPHLPDEIRRARLEILRASTELKDLVTGPSESMRYMAFNYNDQTTLNALLRFNIATSFPVGETRTFTEIAEATNINETDIRRILHHTITNRIFCEPSPDVVAHTAASRALVEDVVLRQWVSMNIEEIMPASVKLLEAMEKYPASQEMTQTAFQVANGTENVEPVFATIGKDPRRAKRFGEAMSSFSDGEGYEVYHLVDNYDFERVDKTGGTFVDIGGSHGFVSVDIANKFKNMKFVVQDLPRTVASAPKLPGDLGERIKFQAHDFNTVQPVKDADIYFFRWIFHNQPTKYAINLIRQLIPALKRGARVVIKDHVLPSRTGVESLWDEKLMRTMDMVMITLLNAQERTREEFEALFRDADPAFRFVGVLRPDRCRMGIIEAVWEGEDYGGMGSKEGARDT